MTWQKTSTQRTLCMVVPLVTPRNQKNSVLKKSYVRAIHVLRIELLGIVFIKPMRLPWVERYLT